MKLGITFAKGLLFAIVKIIKPLASVRMSQCNTWNCCSVEMCFFFQEVIVAPKIAAI